MPNKISIAKPDSFALVLGGGNALGSYQAGAYQALHEHGLEPDRVLGASAGAINGAIICGNPAERRIERLEALWRRSDLGDQPAAAIEEARRTAAASWTIAAGNPAMFLPRNPMSRWWDPYASKSASSIYDATPLGGTLDRLIDFDLLNGNSPRFAVTAVDVETGEDVIFDTAHGRVGVEHLRGSAALMPAFAPVEVGGRLLGDAGISANLPLDAALSEIADAPMLCIAVDLLPLRGPRPNGMGETLSRMQDLVFATQSRRAIAAWQAIFAERARRGDTASVTLLHIAYSDQAREVSGKAFDFSPETASARWQAGHVDMMAALTELASGAIEIGQPGLAIYAAEGPEQRPRRVEWQLAPVRG